VPGLLTLTAAISRRRRGDLRADRARGPCRGRPLNKAKALAPVRFFNPIAMRFAKKATRDDINEVIEAHANAARFAIRIRFRRRRNPLGHNYFASSFLSPLINVAPTSSADRWKTGPRWRAGQ